MRAILMRCSRRIASRQLCTDSKADVAVVGAGHNGLVAAGLLAKQGLKVRVFEQYDIVGGACRTEYPFAKAPGLGASTGAYLLGVMPPELLQILELNVPVLVRDPHYFLPTTGNKYLLCSSNLNEVKQQFETFFSQEDWKANQRLQDEVSAIRDDIAPCWLRPPMPLEETAERYCRLPDSRGTWAIVEGGMGTVTQRLSHFAQRQGAVVETGRPVEHVVVRDGSAVGVVTTGGEEVRASVVVVNADPFRLREMCRASGGFPAEFDRRLDAMMRDGTSMKVNLALSGLPGFKCLPDDPRVHGTTIHLLPDEGDVINSFREAYRDAAAGTLPNSPCIEMYIHTARDPSLRDKEGRHSAALFVQWVPFELAESSWEDEAEGYVRHLLSICDRFAPGTSDLVIDDFTLTPPMIERHFGITRGHIQHIDNTLGFADRFPYSTPIPGLYSASAGCHPAGSVIGCAGHNCAVQVIQDLGLQPAWVVP
ncbi:unnamed protein product [Ostreobium quekettii]|uniref:Pyridine nucleotide-disulfide oxidoreductase domain-containing protein 2 n=1 Tax=Ostreobium quekettii TaxID=121088 RepID=A0A8S1IRL4_9CHLO|nr:unnamed protein product [Ostreobium quekettii]|eukprot:evm.model.scf_119EXC.6 EVM.evm.TU.scf_119EXC.6   scf_119EXC:31081-38979(+)